MIIMSMNRTEALARLTELGFSTYDAQKMVTTNAIHRAVGGQIASGLTDTAEVKVFYRSGRYQVEQWSRGKGPAPCMCGDGYRTAADPALAAAQRRAELMGSYGRQQEVQKRIHDTKGTE